MKEYNISGRDCGQRLDKYIMRILPKAGISFVYKMLRKKNIVLNGKKASGKELLCNGDNIRFYLSDDTFSSFAKEDESVGDLAHLMPQIAYEDDDVLIVNKPSGLLSQRSKADDISLNEICLSYVRDAVQTAEDATFRPSVCNRLDRNTSGLVTFAKTYRAANILSEAFRDHKIGKFYRCIVLGTPEEALLEGYLEKDSAKNIVTISNSSNGGSYIKTKVTPIRTAGDICLCEIELFTGKTHQIRAHLAGCSHPIIGDCKYGNSVINERYRKEYGIRSQMLVCHKLVFPNGFKLDLLSGKTIEISLPKEWQKVM